MLEQKELQKAIARIQQMEQYFDEVLHALDTNPEAIYEDADIQYMVQRLTEYMDGGLWLQDYECDEGGELPKDLKRGVLSQDALHNLLCDIEAEKKKLDKVNVELNYQQVQKIAKDTIEYAKQHIHAGMNLIEIRKMCEEKMLELGADSFWYWDVGAFVFAGDETIVSISGTQYKTSDRTIAENDIITIDLSPQNKDIWGDFARTLIVQDGSVVEPESVLNGEWKHGLEMEDFLHNELFQFVTPMSTFEELYYHMNQVIEEKGFINLDFMGNLGHSIVKQKNDRIYIEKGNKIRLGDVAYFTFEPHISVSGSKFGYKKENIYYFENGELVEL